MLSKLLKLVSEFCISLGCWRLWMTDSSFKPPAIRLLERLQEKYMGLSLIFIVNFHQEHRLQTHQSTFQVANTVILWNEIKMFSFLMIIPILCFRQNETPHNDLKRKWFSGYTLDNLPDKGWRACNKRTYTGQKQQLPRPSMMSWDLCNSGMMSNSAPKLNCIKISGNLL